MTANHNEIAASHINDAAYHLIAIIPTSLDNERLAKPGTTMLNHLGAVNQQLETRGILPQTAIGLTSTLGAIADLRANSAEAVHIHASLTELHAWTGRSNHNIEKDLRDTLATMSSTQIAAVNQQYKSNFGIDLKDALAADNSLSNPSKVALTIYMKGADHRNADDTLKLANLSTAAGNLDMFEEAFRDAAPQARSAYLANGGALRVQAAFGGVFSNSDVRHALDYVRGGKLSVETQVRDNTGIFSSNRDAIEHAIGGMTSAQKEQYQKGGMPYLRQALQHAGNDKDQLRWNAEIKGAPSLQADHQIKAGDSASESPALNARDAFNSAREKEYKSNDGIGRALIRNFWDGTSDQSTDAINQYAAEMSRNAAAGTTISAARQAAQQQEVGESLEQLKKSKDAAGNAVADGALIVAGVGGAAFTGGASLALFGAVTAGGAAAKIATKAAISGNDYDYSAGHVLADGATGAVTAATMFVGPAQIGRLVGITGERAALSLGTDVALNSGAGAAAGVATGTVEGMANWDRTKSIGGNLGEIGQSALLRGATGALLAGALSGTIGGVSKFAAVRAAESQPLASIVEHAPESKLSADTKIIPAAQMHDIDGRPFSETAARRELIDKKFAPMPEGEKAALRTQVASELRDVKAIGPDGHPGSAYDSLMQDTTLSGAQKENILNNMGLVREHLASYRQGERMHSDPELNWIHTQGEIAKVLEVSRLGKLSANETEDALLASMYSDSVKFSAPAPEGTIPNFHTHHLDGALAAEHSLKLQGFPQERIDNVVEAILAHQITPPKFMGQLYYLKINGTLEAMIKDSKLSVAEGQQMRETLAEMTTTGPDGVKRISKIADVSNAPIATAATGRQEVIFSVDEKKVLALSGTDRWTVPYKAAHDPSFKTLSRSEQELRLSRGRIADKMKDADCADNYATSGGASKIVALRGPGSFFTDKTVWDSINSIEASFQDSYAVMSSEGRAVADASLGNLKKVTDPESGSLKHYMDKWLLDNKGLDASKDSIPFYNAPLSYAKAGETPGADQAAETDLAVEIRSAVINYLRRNHRTANDLPGNFAPVRH
jgi:hypothetical protein